jgi:hypothetical protein
MISDWGSERRLYVDQIRAVLQYHMSADSQGRTFEQICQAEPRLDQRKAQEALDLMVEEGVAVRNVCYKLTDEINLLDITPSKKR